MGRRRRRIGKSSLSKKQLRFLFASKFKTTTSSSRSEASKRGHDTRTRKEGIRQLASGALDLSHPVLSTIKAGKDIGLGTAKIIAPRKIRKSKVAKGIDVI